LQERKRGTARYQGESKSIPHRRGEEKRTGGGARGSSPGTIHELSHLKKFFGGIGAHGGDVTLRAMSTVTPKNDQRVEAVLYLDLASGSEVSPPNPAQTGRAETLTGLVKLYK